MILIKYYHHLYALYYTLFHINFWNNIYKACESVLTITFLWKDNSNAFFANLIFSSKEVNLKAVFLDPAYFPTTPSPPAISPTWRLLSNDYFADIILTSIRLVALKFSTYPISATATTFIVNNTPKSTFSSTVHLIGLGAGSGYHRV